MALSVGSRLGHYDVTALIGEGGMGQVYQATDTKLKRQVALPLTQGLRGWIAATVVSAGLVAGGCSAPSEEGEPPLSQGETPEGTWNIDARMLPAPAGASAELRDSIASGPAPMVAAAAFSTPDTVEAWAEIVAALDPQTVARGLAMAEALGVTIERVEIGGVVARHVRPAAVRPEHAAHLFVHLHGGGYFLGGGDASVEEAVLIAARVQIPVLSIDYRMPPAHPFPAALDDVVAVWEHILTEQSAAMLALGGTSAGGGLVLAAVHKLVELGWPVPGAIFVGTPWADLTKTGDTLFINEGIDRGLIGYELTLSAAAQLYSGGHDMRDPLLSPVYGDFEGFPPTYLVTGTRDLLLSDTARTHRKLREAGVTADLNVYEGMAHAGYIFVPDAPESHQVFRELDLFLRRHLR